MSGLGNFLAAEAEAGRSGGHSPVDAILDAVRQHLGMEIAFTSRYVGDEREFTHLSADIPLPSAPGDREPVDQSYCWHILNGRLPELIHDAADFPFAQTLPISAALPVGAHISVPLRLGDGSVYGSFCCLSRSPDRSLTERDLATVRAFADLAAAQIAVGEDEARRRAAIVARTRAAISGGEPTIHLQPIHRLDDGLTVGAEALARFPDCRDRPPNLWFQEAFDVDLGIALELAAAERALAALPFVPEGQYLSVNVSPATLLSGALEALLKPHRRARLVIEITEHARVEDHDALRWALTPLRAHARIAIDDVGAGYAGLQTIIAFAPDILKLDMSLTRGIDGDPAKRALAVALVRFASEIGSTIVAEGIEREAEREVLLGLGVAYGQGWAFSKAMPVVSAQQRMLGLDRAGAQQVDAAAAPPEAIRKRAGRC
jgi:EAL domain-containing protein (putative c-di-GMP-specific phosphodiesterase class I)